MVEQKDTIFTGNVQKHINVEKEGYNYVEQSCMYVREGINERTELNVCERGNKRERERDREREGGMAERKYIYAILTSWTHI